MNKTQEEIAEIKLMDFESKQIQEQQRLMKIVGWSVSMPDKIAIGTGVDQGEIVDENGFYIWSPQTRAEIVNRYNIHSELLEFVKDYAYHQDCPGGDHEKVCAAVDLIARAGDQ